MELLQLGSLCLVIPVLFISVVKELVTAGSRISFWHSTDSRNAPNSIPDLNHRRVSSIILTHADAFPAPVMDISVAAEPLASNWTFWWKPNHFPLKSLPTAAVASLTSLYER